MKPEELIGLVKKAVEQRLDRCPLTMEAPVFHGPYPRRVRTPFGLCEWYPSASPERILIFPKVDQIVKWLDKRLAHEAEGRKE
jgi:hypothetical protein